MKFNNWIAYTGDDEQIIKILKSDKYFMVDAEWCVFSNPTKVNISPTEENIVWLREILNSVNVKKFILADRHPCYDMYKIWIETNQPVWYRNKLLPNITGLCDRLFLPFIDPENFEYSFDSFEE